MFLDSMRIQQPKTTFRDQYIMWPNQLDELCQIHKPRSLFQKCIKGCDSEEEFERT